MTGMIVTFSKAYKNFLTAGLLVFSFTAYCQTPETVKATVDKNKILIGEQIHLKVEAIIPVNQPYTVLKIDSVPHFEILQAGEPLESRIEDDKTVIQNFQLTSFDSGHWVIPAFRIAGEFYTDTIPIDVVFSEFDPKQNYHDIKDIIEVKVEAEKKNSWYWYAAASIILLGFIIYLLV